MFWCLFSCILFRVNSLLLLAGIVSLVFRLIVNLVLLFVLSCTLISYYWFLFLWYCLHFCSHGFGSLGEDEGLFM